MPSRRKQLETATGLTGRNLSITDLLKAYYRAGSGLTRGGSLGNHRAAFYRKKLGTTKGTILDARSRLFPRGVETYAPSGPAPTDPPEFGAGTFGSGVFGQ